MRNVHTLRKRHEQMRCHFFGAREIDLTGGDLEAVVYGGHVALDAGRSGSQNPYVAELRALLLVGSTGGLLRNFQTRNKPCG